MTPRHSLLLAQTDAPPAGQQPAGQNGAPAPDAGAPPTEGADGGTTPQDQPRPQMSPIDWLPFLLIFVVIIFVMWLPQRRREKQRKAMLAAIRKGDRVQTIGGILGNVVEVRDHEIILKVDESSNTRMRFARAAIQAVLPEGKPTDEAA